MKKTPPKKKTGKSRLPKTDASKALGFQKVETPWYDNYVAEAQAAIAKAKAKTEPTQSPSVDKVTAIKLSLARLQVQEFLATLENFDTSLLKDSDFEVIPADELQISDFQPWMVRFSTHLNVPAEVSNRIVDFDRLEPWEREAWLHCTALVNARRQKCLVDEESAAQSIGAVIAGQLLADNDAALRIVAAGLRNVANGKVFRPLAGKQASQEDAIAVTVAFYELVSKGIIKPAIVEIQAWLRKNSGLRYDRKFLSKLLDRLGLGELKGDARISYSAAGQRRRGGTHVANQCD